MDEMFDDALSRLLTDICPASAVRAVEAGMPAGDIWTPLAESGFLDVLVPESHGGAGLSTADAFGLFTLAGRHALPVPFAATALVRARAAEAGFELPEGAITIAPAAQQSGPQGAIVCRNVPFGLVADKVLVALPDRALLLPAASAQRSSAGVHGSLAAHFEWPADVVADEVFPAAGAWREAAAALTAAAIAGALDFVLADTVRHVNERSQFGRSIGKFQAVQHQMSVLASQVRAARMAAAIGCADLGNAHAVGTAKLYTSQVAALAAATAHGLHGAMGITEEYDLQLYTRRLHEWRADYGSEQYWSLRLGRALLEARDTTTLDFMRSTVLPAGFGQAA